MASCAAGKTFRVYGQYTSLVCKLMIKTWGHIFEANEKKNTKNTCEPSKNLTPFLVDFATIQFQLPIGTSFIFLLNVQNSQSFLP